MIYNCKIAGRKFYYKTARLKIRKTCLSKYECQGLNTIINNMSSITCQLLLKRKADDLVLTSKHEFGRRTSQLRARIKLES